MIYSVSIGKPVWVSHSRPFRSFPEIHAFSGKSCLFLKQPEKSSSIQVIFQLAPYSSSLPLCHLRWTTFFYRHLPSDLFCTSPHPLHESLLEKSLKSLSISATILTASSFPMAFQPSVRQSSSAGTVILGSVGTCTATSITAKCAARSKEQSKSKLSVCQFRRHFIL